MQRRILKPFWLFLALLFFGQSLSPAAAVAQVSMRCIGAPASSPPCAQAAFAVADLSPVAARAACLPCCRMVTGCPMMAPHARTRSRGTARVRHPRLASRPLCLLSVKLLSIKPAARAPRARARQLASALALVPAAALLPNTARRAPAAAAFPAPACPLFASVLPHSHGLRAPPAA